MRKKVVIILVIFFVGCFNNEKGDFIEIEAPKNNQVILRTKGISLDWEKSNENVLGLNYEVFYTQSGYDNWKRIGKTKETWIYIPERLKWQTSYKWKVLVKNEHGKVLEEKSDLFQTPDILDINSPLQEEILTENDQVKLDWRKLDQSLDGFKFEVSYSNINTDDWINLGNTIDTEVSIEDDIGWDNKYEWKIIVKDDEDIEVKEYKSNFYSPKSITFNYPEESEVIEVTDGVILDWEKVNSNITLDYYEVYFDNGTGKFEDVGSTTKTSISLDIKLKWNNEYRWKVKPIFEDVEDSSSYESKFYTSNPENLYNTMEEIYLWNNNIPSNIDYNKYNNYDQLLNSMLYSLEQGGYDRWSFIISYDEYLSWSSNSEYKGVGFGFLWRDGKLMIKRVYKGSPGDKAGLERGDEILSINGENIVERDKEYFEENIDEILSGEIMEIEVEKNDESKFTYSIQKEVIEVHPVQETKVIDIKTNNEEDKKVGYMVFDTFNGEANSELESAITSFGAIGIDEMVLDLRYNGGGNLKICQNLANLLANNSYAGEIFTTLTYNDILTENYGEENYLFSEHEKSLDLEKLYVITTKDSASASEYLINGLEPFMDVIIIGDDTHGKPVGMNGIFLKDGVPNYMNPEDVLFPITFKGVNSKGEFDGYKFNTDNEDNIYDGLTRDYPVDDDITHELGSEDEACLKAALTHIKKGSFPSLAQKRDDIKRVQQFKTQGFRSLIGAY